jgi:prephenate dehydrogenase
MRPAAVSVCIVGLGLMGGSLALALRRAGGETGEDEPPATGPEDDFAWRVVGVDHDADNLQAALRAGAIDAAADLTGGVRQANAVVLAVPVRTILSLLPQVGQAAGDGTLVLDLGSTKAPVCAAMAHLPPGLQPVGGHPMCGTEHAGFAAAHAELYRDRPFVLCPLPRTAPAGLALARRLACAAGARPVVAQPEAHDRAVAAISHAPYAVAAALVGSVDLEGDSLAWELAASGFRDTTRIAGSNLEVMLDALVTNRTAVLDRLDLFTTRLAALRGALARNDEAELRSQLAAARQRRRQLA